MIEKNLPKNKFLRINRQVIVNINVIKSIYTQQGQYYIMLANEEKMSVSERNVTALKRLLGI
jgi:DNA-binding LytR/AlgR family response regulator